MSAAQPLWYLTWFSARYKINKNSLHCSETKDFIEEVVTLQGPTIVRIRQFCVCLQLFSKLRHSYVFGTKTNNVGLKLKHIAKLLSDIMSECLETRKLNNDCMYTE